MVDRDEDGNIRKGPLQFLLDPKPTKIPPQLKDDIYKAEANTAAAKERQTRVLAYTVVAFLGISSAFLNVFLTELRSTVMEAADPQQIQGSVVSFEDIGWGWVGTNFLFQFLFANKIGGALALVGGAGSAMMVEAEVDSQRANAEEIWDELERRRSESQTTKKKRSVASAGKAPQPARPSSGKNKPSGAQRKRLAALSEVVLDDPDVVSEAVAVAEEDADSPKGDSVLGKLKGWYEQADSMAAAQALLLNKELEDKGVLEKITDETGLRVIGKEAAAKLQQEVKELKEE